MAVTIPEDPFVYFTLGSTASCTRPLQKALIPLAATVPPAAIFISGKTRFYEKEEVDTQPAVERQKPPSIDVLFQITKFSRSEIQYLYRTFKELWPNGMVELGQFQSIYADIFPQGNSKPYSELVFRSIDQKRTGSITFLDFITSFSKIAKGNTDEKLDWIFTLYDFNANGYIGYQDIYNVVGSMYQLVDATLKPAVIATICRQHVKLVFKNLKIESGGRVSRQEFLEKCKQNSEIIESFVMFGSLHGSIMNI